MQSTSLEGDRQITFLQYQEEAAGLPPKNISRKSYLDSGRHADNVTIFLGS